jgi:hypothetical protein
MADESMSHDVVHNPRLSASSCVTFRTLLRRLGQKRSVVYMTTQSSGSPAEEDVLHLLAECPWCRPGLQRLAVAHVLGRCDHVTVALTRSPQCRRSS